MYKDYISWIDLLLVPLYFVLLYGVMVYIKKRNPGNILVQKYLLKGFVFKIACTIFYCMLIYYYYGFGDTINYFKNVLDVRERINDGSESFKVLFENSTYMNDTDSGWFLERIALVLSYFSFSRFIICSMLFATIAYSGMFKMFQTFVEIMPEWHKRLAFVVLFFPTVGIYGSGILKDTLCISSLGWIMYCSNQLFVKKHLKLKYLLILALCVTIICMVKVYIIVALAVPYILYLLMSLVKKIPSRFFRRIVLPVLLGILVIVYIISAKKIDSMLGNFAVDKIFNTVSEQQKSYLDDADAGSTFDLGSFDPTFSGFLKKMPAGIVATLYRPFLWESRSLLLLFSALESFLILIITIYVIWKTGVWRFIKTIFNDPFIFLCISYTIIFAAIVGLSTFNFGTLARYRIPVIPFYLTGIFAILYHVKKINQKKPREKIV